jgi:hypothetical protein
VKSTAFRCELRNRFSALDLQLNEMIEEHLHYLRKTWTSTCEEVLGKRTRNTSATCRLSTGTSTGKSREVQEMTSQRKQKQQRANKT